MLIQLGIIYPVVTLGGFYQFFIHGSCKELRCICESAVCLPLGYEYNQSFSCLKNYVPSSVFYFDPMIIIVDNKRRNYSAIVISFFLTVTKGSIFIQRELKQSVIAVGFFISKITL